MTFANTDTMIPEPSLVAFRGLAAAPLRAMGGLYEAQAVVRRPTDLDGMRELFADAHRSRCQLTLSAGRRSFGEHFLPQSGAIAVDTRGLGGDVEVLGVEGSGGVTVRVPASFSFEELHTAFPGALPRHPPTGDRITLGGAVAACTHNCAGYFADDIRALELLTPRGDLIRCAPGEDGLGGQLFDLLPGSFGALGVNTHVELELRPVAPGARVEIEVVENCPAQGFACVDLLEQRYRSEKLPFGRGMFVYGCRGTTVLVENRQVEETAPRRSSLPLTDEATVRNIVLQGIAHRLPTLVHRLQPRVLRKGRRFQASAYGFCYYQRSYDRAFDWLSSQRMSSRVMRAAGVDPRLTVCHQTFAIPPDRVHRFLELYFDELSRHPRAIRRLEQQDLIRLPPCRWPLHGAYGLDDGSYLFTASFSVQRDRESYRQARRCLQEVSARAFRELGVKVMLLKQAHCDPELLRQMHAGFIERLEDMRSIVDPNRILGSRLFDGLLH